MRCARRCAWRNYGGRGGRCADEETGAVMGALIGLGVVRCHGARGCVTHNGAWTATATDGTLKLLGCLLRSRALCPMQACTVGRGPLFECGAKLHCGVVRAAGGRCSVSMLFGRGVRVVVAMAVAALWSCARGAGPAQYVDIYCSGDPKHGVLSRKSITESSEIIPHGRWFT